MRNGKVKLQADPVQADHQQMLVGDAVRFLSSLSKLYEEDKIGNPALSKGLKDLSRALRPYSEQPVSELADIIRSKATTRSNPKAVEESEVALFLPELESMSQEGVESTLAEERITKNFLVELGFQRFGISRSKLERLSKRDARASVRSALEHEKSLDAISREAQRSGKLRTA